MERDEFYDALYLAHHGVKGQKWGVRRYQNRDGSLTSEGERRENSNDSKPKSRLKTALKVGLGITGTALAAYGAYKLANNPKVRSAVQNGINLVKSAANSKSDTKALDAKTKEILDRSKEIREKAEKELRSTEKVLNDGDYNARILESLRKMEEMGRTGKKSK